MKHSSRQIDLGKVSKSVLELNPGLTQMAGAAPQLTASVRLGTQEGSDTPQGAPKRRRRKVMNRTEAEFALHLQAMKDRGEIHNFAFEGLTIRWGDAETAMTYTADFAVIVGVEGVVTPKVQLRFIEIKGSQAWREGILRFKAAKVAHPEFEFQLHEKGKDGWQRTV